MTHRGPFQPLLFCDSVTWNSKPGAQVPWCWVSVVPVRRAAALAGAARNARPELAWRSSETFTGRAPSNPQASDAGLKHRARTRGRALLPPNLPGQRARNVLEFTRTLEAPPCPFKHWTTPSLHSWHPHPDHQQGTIRAGETGPFGSKTSCRHTSPLRGRGSAGTSSSTRDTCLCR